MQFFIEEIKQDVHENGELLKQTVSSGNLEAVKHLVETCQINVDSCDDGHLKITPLHVAARMGYLEIADYLIKIKASLESCDSCSLLAFGIMSGKLEMVQLLVKNGVEINRSTNYQPEIEYALEGGVIEVFEYLLELKIPMTPRALFFAANGGSLGMFKHLVQKYGMSIPTKPVSPGYNLRYFILNVFRGQNIDILRYVVEEMKFDLRSYLIEELERVSIKHCFTKLP